MPILGNAADIDSEFPLGSLINLADKYGEIYRLNFPGGRTSVVVSTQALIHELCDESRFQKCVGPVLEEVRNGVHDGLFTAFNGETNWDVAHRILMPAFGPVSIQSMFPEMRELAAQLALKWARHGPNTSIPVSDDMTRLTLDTLALCAMNFRFNSYYREDLHPFLSAMADYLVESGNRSRRPAFTSMFYRHAEKKYREDIELLRKTALDVLKQRKGNPDSSRKDLLQAMLDGVDSKTGLKLSDDAVVNNLITFLIAGHETTSGLLSFTFYNLLSHPECYRKVQEEVDRAVGTGAVKVEHLNKLPYVAAVLRETLRLSAPIPIFTVEAKEDGILGGKYAVKQGEPINCLLARSHLDPRAYGPTAQQFIPERMLDENFERLTKEFPDCWKPFGNGMRACIGRPFAWQEAVLVLALLFQNFNFLHADPGYELKIKQTLTIKPKDFRIRAVLREGMTAHELEYRVTGSRDGAAAASGSAASGRPGTASAKRNPLNIYYGSNTGTCEALAQRLAGDASSHGFSASVVDPLDVAQQNLPTDRPVIIITASYEGNPADNAALFVEWIENLKAKELEKVSYAVFGCGHHDWAQTFHRIPKLLDTTLEARGASRVCPIGLTDAAANSIFTDFEHWEDELLWPALEERYGTAETAEGITPSVSVQFSTPRAANLRQDVKDAVVVDARDLAPPGLPAKKHIEIRLPSDMSYTAGDYLAVLPLNPKEYIARVMRRFHLAWDSHVTIESDMRTSLPVGHPVSVTDLLGAYVELAQPATKRDILILSEAAKDEGTKKQLQSLAGTSYTAEISQKRASVLDLLERFPAVALPFGVFLTLLPPMRVRQYSISSSPLWNPSHVTLTYSVLDSPSHSDPSVRHVGVATSYLASLVAGEKLGVSVRRSHSAFRLPTEPEHAPVILIAAGAGLAPFRGFVQERAAQIGAGRGLAPALLFYGCHGPDADDLYRSEFDAWQAAGAVDVRRAYSRVDFESSPRAKDAEGCRHVDDRLWRDRKDVVGLYEQGARVYVCGSMGVGEAVRKVLVRIAKDAKEQAGEVVTVESVEKWFEGIRNERYATDVFD